MLCLIAYALCSINLTGGQRFEVDALSGEIITVGTAPFMLDKEYVLYVKAEDLSGPVGERQYQSTKEERLSIVGGKRPPQFYVPQYEATIPESQKKDSEYVFASLKAQRTKIRISEISDKISYI